MSRRAVGVALIGASTLSIAAAALYSYAALDEAYGSGPPYYSRSTNMDKWSDPLPEVLLTDALVLVAAGLVGRAGVRRLRGNGGAATRSRRRPG